MSDQLIKDFPTLTTAQLDDGTKLMASGVAATGKLYQFNMNQLKLVVSTQSVYYTATGAEGTALVIAALSARQILGIWREGLMMYPVVATPDSVSYTWNLTTITFGSALNAGERLGILYRNA